MKRIHIVCEGPTEQTFVREILQFEYPGLHLIPILPGKTYAKRQAGGNVKYARVRPDILNSLKMDSACCCSTFLDYYALGTDFPENGEPHGTDPENKAARIERAVEQDIARTLGASFEAHRFRCYISMHEFEGLLFSNPINLADALGVPESAMALKEIRDAVASPEHINDHPNTAPSKRLKQVCPGYDKIVGGNIAAMTIGIPSMKTECAHFRTWVDWFHGFTEET
jgi:hypothetical protein